MLCHATPCARVTARPITQYLYACGALLEPRGRNKPIGMSKNLRASMTEEEYHRFKAVKAELSANTNDEAIVRLMDLYQSDSEND